MTPELKPIPKLVCTDFDGTIHDERNDPPIAAAFEKTILQLQARGVRWVINTGRYLPSLLEELARSGLHARPDYAVVVEREIYIHQESQYVAHTPWNTRCDAVHHQLFVELAEEIPKLFEWVNANFNATVYEDAWSPFCVIAEHVGDNERIVRHLEKWGAAWPELAVVCNDVYARLSHIDFNKGTALREVARLSEARPENIFAAGDHLNDLPMLKRELAHGLAAPVNAIAEVKDVVRAEGGFVAAEKSGAGVATALDRWLVGKPISEQG